LAHYMGFVDVILLRELKIEVGDPLKGVTCKLWVQECSYPQS
jgi:hypothetical protein